VVIDSVDVHFRRLFAKARITRAERDYLIAEEMRAVESEVYRRGDLVIAVSEEDRMTLRREIEDLPVELIPNIHAVLPLAARNGRLRNSLIFIGNFQHSPNVDAMLYFCKDVLPLVEVTVPDIHLTIVGSAPPEKLKKLADEHVKVLGFVPDILPILEASAISIAPLRYGAGLKGKIGEAMAYGLPVVTTSTGAEGFGLTPGENVLLGDTPEAFARAITALVRDADLYERVRRAAWQLVNERYSVNAVSIRIQEVVDRLNRYPIKRLGLARRLEMTVRYQLGRHVSWRLKQAG
jgi:glycosyltransferase involved in cell wall biosynthesis